VREHLPVGRRRLLRGRVVGHGGQEGGDQPCPPGRRRPLIRRGVSAGLGANVSHTESCPARLGSGEVMKDVRATNCPTRVRGPACTARWT
jgi:hypothetical protein